MIRVLSIIHHTEFSGPTNRNMRIASFLGHSGVDFTVLVPDRPLGSAYKRLKLAGTKIIQTRFHRLRTTRNLKEQIRIFLNFFPDIQRIRKIIRKKRIDVVQLNGLMNPHGAIAAKLEGKKVVWQLIDTYSPFLLMLILMPFVVLMADAVMATGKRTADSHPLFGLIKDRLFYFNPPVDLKNYIFDPSLRRQARAAIGLSPDDVLFSGSFVSDAERIFHNAEKVADNTEILHRVEMAELPVLYLKCRQSPELAVYDGTYAKFNRIVQREGITHYAESGERNKAEFHQRMESFRQAVGE